ncbi:MAG: peptide-methionine (S)-S-oxide reductase MsrA [Salibacteraceae bacterium]
MINESKIETAILGAGCFWCIETIFQQLNGVISVKSGYSGGFIKNPSYKEVCNGTTGHAEVAKIEFDSKIISFTEILEVFFKVHDPTTLNRQGGDVGTQYRSAIFYTSEEQKITATQLKDKLTTAGIYANPIVTEITEFDVFYPAEDYHNDYFNQHGDEGYCRLVIQPKVDKFKKVFEEKLKK